MSKNSFDVSRIESESNPEKSEKHEFRVGNLNLEVVVRKKETDTARIFVDVLNLRNDQGKVFSVLSLLPADWKLVLWKDMPDMQAQANNLNREILLPRTRMKESKNKIPDGEDLPEDKRTRTDSIFGPTFYDRKVSGLRREVRKLERVPIFENNPEIFLTIFHEVGHAYHPNNKLPDDFNERMDLISRQVNVPIDKLPEERDAWAFAIREIRKLKENGFDFGEVFSNENLRRLIDFPLQSYSDSSRSKNKK